MRGRDWLRLLGAGVVVFAAVTAVLLLVAAAASTSGSRRRAAPEFTLRDQNDRTHRLEAYRGRVVLLTVAPLDHPNSLPTLRALRDAGTRLDDLGIKTFALTGAPKDTLRKLYSEEELGFPLLQDPGGAVMSAYRDAGFGRGAGGPTTYLIGPEGRVVDEVAAKDPGHHVRLLLSAARCCMGKMQWTGGIADGRVIPDTKVQRVDRTASDTLRSGKPSATVVLVLSTECPCSQSYEGRIQAMAREYHTRGVRFVGLFPNTEESAAEIRRYGQTRRFDFPLVRDPGGRLAAELGAKVTPEAFLLDRDGRLRYQGRIDDSRDPARVSRHELREALDEVVAGRLPTHASGPLIGCALSLESP